MFEAEIRIVRSDPDRLAEDFKAVTRLLAERNAAAATHPIPTTTTNQSPGALRLLKR